jgi:multidrug efflux pump subunit AcrA (membrane-fusion protein)
MLNMFQNLFKIALRHKIIAGVLVAALAGAGYYGYKTLWGNVTEVRYAAAAVQKGTLVVSVSGSGQISASNQVDIKPKVSGDVVWVGIKASQEVEMGQTLLNLDDTDAQKAVADAELDLEETKLNLDKAVAQAPIDYKRKLESLKKAKDDLEKEYENTFNAISNAFLDLPAVMTGIQNILFGENLEKQSHQWNVDVYRNLFDKEDKDLVGTLADIAEKDYRTAREAYDKNLTDFKNITRYSERVVLEELLQETLNTTKAIAQATKSESNLLDTVMDIANKKTRSLNSLIATFQSNLRSYLGTINSNLSSLLSQKSLLENTKATITDTERDISILEINNPTGINPIDLQIAQNNIKKKESALADLKAKLADYAIRAPFAGIITKVNVKKGDSTSAGTTLTTLITRQKIAEVSLNEVDVAKIKVGQKVTLAFDAVEGLSITGEVAEIDAIGTVTQGVVNYNVKIVFDTQDEGVKPGMSVSAAIITDVKQDVLLVPNSAIKSNGNGQYVEILTDNTPQSRTVETGISNDTMTEIVSGLKEGDRVVTQTITANTNTTQTQSRSTGIGIPGLGGPR